MQGSCSIMVHRIPSKSHLSKKMVAINIVIIGRISLGIHRHHRPHVVITSMIAAFVVIVMYHQHDCCICRHCFFWSRRYTGGLYMLCLLFRPLDGMSKHHSLCPAASAVFRCVLTMDLQDSRSQPLREF